VGEHVYSETVTVAAPPDLVWRVLADVEQWPTWTASMEQVAVRSPGPLAVGSEVEVKQPRLPKARFHVDEVTEGSSFTWSTASGGVRSSAAHDIHPDGGGSRVTLVLRQAGPMAGLVRLAYGRMITRYVRMEAEGLKQRAESLT
jgi:uncharacterized protein YndB with AHSA1/START domain